MIGKHGIFAGSHHALMPMPTYAKALMRKRVDLRTEFTLKRSRADESRTDYSGEQSFRLVLSGD